MRMSRIVTWFLVLTISNSACSDQLVRYHGYGLVVQEFEGGTVRLNVVGTPNVLSGSLTEYRAPYSIIVRVETASPRDSVTATGIRVSSPLDGEDYTGIPTVSPLEWDPGVEAFVGRIALPTSVPYADISVSTMIEMWFREIPVSTIVEHTLIPETREETRSLADQFSSM